MEIDRLGFIHENFYPGDSVVKQPENFEQNREVSF